MTTIQAWVGFISTCDKPVADANPEKHQISGHATIAKALGVQCFFARPYHSWERGLNEHTNGLLRQFFPKGTNFKITKPGELQRAVDLINHRPRKSLDYRTPHEVFYKHTSDSVALQI
jgi:IS30 family transposase